MVDFIACAGPWVRPDRGWVEERSGPLLTLSSQRLTALGDPAATMRLPFKPEMFAFLNDVARPARELKA